MRKMAFTALIAMTIPQSAEASSCRASYYGGGEYLNAHTANGERFHAGAMTAAHRTLPFGTLVRVTYHGRSVVVRINDRGPAKSTGRCIDLSRGAAAKIGMIKAGVGTVKMSVVGGSKQHSRRKHHVQ